MKRRKPKWEDLEPSLRRAHESRPEPLLTEQWQDDLMRRVDGLRRRPRLRERYEDSMAGFARLLFRFAGAGAVVAAGLLLYSHMYAPDLDRHAAGMILEQPAAPVSLESLIWS
ncbi:MAG: hypothetical protein KKC30_05250 [Proteobacteria bacterium]|nr:hypothetical protein [Pseudomonadota bacterium]MBU4384752.1 hypothetical protein [Pseudomonadota bacterium]MBU4605303.1 hypothetical protein [Pseudomonadota bacterium]MCG2764062.1 hypothetical protein [Desulfarculaceae bacterium]